MKIINNFTKNISAILSVFLFVLVFIFTASFVWALATPAKFYTTASELKVGQTVDFELKIDGSAEKPVYTAIVNLEYDKNLLTFKGASYQPGWIPVAPDEVTDMANGQIKRTAGYPAGLKTLASILKYTFEAKAPGKATVNILGGSTLDAENRDAGLQNKSITVNIGGTVESLPEIKKEEIKKEEKKLPQVVSLEIKGDTALVTSTPYNFTLENKLKVPQATLGTTTVSVYDINGQEVIKEERELNTASDLSMQYIIPANTLFAGNYTIVASVKHDNQKVIFRTSKDLGVVESTEKIVNTKTSVPFIPFYIWIIIAILAAMLIFAIVYHKSKKLRKFIKNF